MLVSYMDNILSLLAKSFFIVLSCVSNVSSSSNSGLDPLSREREKKMLAQRVKNYKPKQGITPNIVVR